MVRWLHVIPCGTSVLRNFELSRAGEARALGVVGWFRLPPSDPRQEEAWGWDLGFLHAFIIDMVLEVDPTASPFLGSPT